MKGGVMRVLKKGESEIILGRGGWCCEISGSDKGADIRIYNPVGDGNKEKFFAVDTTGNPYGAPMVIQEPTLGVPCNTVNGVEVGGNIVGALVVSEDGKIAERFSWSNLVFIKRIDFSITAEGELIVNGASKGYLRLLFLADKNRIQGFVGVFVPKKPEKVIVKEMEDLLLRQL
jgi:hypothetical protein